MSVVGGDEIFPIARLANRTILAISKGDVARWALGLYFTDGRSGPLIVPRAPAEEVWGGSYYRPYVVLARGRQNTLMEWYHESSMGEVIHSARIGSLHAAPYWDGAAWWVYWRACVPDADASLFGPSW